MRWIVVVVGLVLATSAEPAAADGDSFTRYGVGSAMAKHAPGLAVRMEKRLDATRSEDDEDGLIGGMLGVEAWSAGGQWGFAMPIGMYFGAEVKNVRTSIGGGLGLWALAKRGGDDGFGLAPFVGTTLEVSAGKLVFAIDGRIVRQTLVSMDDYNVYSVMFMFGPRYRRR